MFGANYLGQPYPGQGYAGSYTTRATSGSVTVATTASGAIAAPVTIAGSWTSA